MSQTNWGRGLLSTTGSILGTNNSTGTFNIGQPGGGNQQPGMWTRQAMFGGENQTGWLTGGAQVGSSVLGGFLGLRQMRMGRRQMRQERAFATTNLANQAALTNRQLYNQTREAFGEERAQQELLRWGVSGVAGQTGYQGNNVSSDESTRQQSAKDKQKGQM